MSATPMESFELLYERYCDGELTPEERGEMLRLMERPVYRRRFAELAAFDAAMGEESQIDAQGAKATHRHKKITGRVRPVSLKTVKRRSSQNESVRMAVWLSAACVVLMIGAAIISGHRNASEVSTSTPPKQPDTAPEKLDQRRGYAETAAERERAIKEFKTARERERELQDRLNRLAQDKREHEQLKEAQRNIPEIQRVPAPQVDEKEAMRVAQMEREAAAELEKARAAARTAKEAVIATTKQDLTLGRVVFVDKAAQAFVQRGNEKIPLTLGFELISGDRFITTSLTTLPASPRTDAAITVFSGAELEISAGAELTVESLERIKVARGLIYADVDLGNAVGGVDKRYSLVIETPHASTMVLGTRFELYCSSLETRIQMEEGEVAFSNARRTKNVSAGKMSSARASSEPSEPAAAATSIWRGRKLNQSKAVQMLRKEGKLTINFGPETALPAGMLNDSGEPFDPVLGYGWKGPKVGSVLPNGVHIGNAPMRQGRLVLNGDMAADPILNGWVCGGWVDHSETWTMPVPNGRYAITVCVGDGVNQGPNHVRIEDQQVVNSVMTTTELHVKTDVPITVKDNELTIVIGNHRSKLKAKDESSDTAMNYIIIKRLDDE